MPDRQGKSVHRRSLLRRFVPTLDWERDLWSAGVIRVAGLDEVGRGPLAGPVVAAAVVLPLTPVWPWLSEVRDSKLLSPVRRTELDAAIRRDALAVGLGMASVSTIDSEGIVPATRRAMHRALDGLALAPQHLMIDALVLPDVEVPQTALIHGDGRCASIACASIVAKVARDRMMTDLDCEYPGYGLARNKGYGTPEHLDALARLGPSRLHRRSFAPVRNAVFPLEPAEAGA